MHDFLLKELSKTNIEKELTDIGYDSSYAFKARDKFYYKNYKIYDLTCAQANILKQLALSVGADCGTNKEVITGKIDLSDCILGGSISQLQKIAQKLQLQPFGLKELGRILSETVKENSQTKTKIMGILNVTTNSFSDGGKYYNFDDAINQLHKLSEDGADIIDIGAESTKPYSHAVDSEEQLSKLIPILKYIKENNINIPISIDTRSAQVAQECINFGASIINDVSGLEYDLEMAKIIAQNPKIKVIIQHCKGTPENMQDNPQYENLTDEIFKDLKSKIDYALSQGIKKENIILDPGIGFGKNREDNFEIIRRWQEFKTLECPIMIGISRKSMLGKQNSNEQKDIYTLALNSILINENIDYIRVHNVKLHKDFLNILP